MEKTLVSIIIPTFNEAKVIKKTLISYLKLNIPYQKEIIVVDDNSRDGTASIVEEIASNNSNLRLIVRKNKSGFGSALFDGTKAAKGNYVIWTMADGCDELSAVPKMLAKLDRGYDIVVASRNMKGGDRGDQPILKSICSWSFSLVMRVLFRAGVRDSTNAFRAFKKKIINKITLKANDFSISPEMVLKGRKAGLKIGEVPVKYKERVAGKTKFRVLKMGKSFLKVLFEGVFSR
jgi:dolichol-phosphate mannosyltransferase